MRYKVSKPSDFCKIPAFGNLFMEFTLFGAGEGVVNRAFGQGMPKCENAVFALVKNVRIKFSTMFVTA